MIRAPQDGYVVRALRGGIGEQLKEGDPVVTILPASPRSAVALQVSAADVALLGLGRKVRLQFDGWPALQFSGWPAAAVGTFGGVVAVIDPVAGPDGAYGVLVPPRRERPAVAGAGAPGLARRRLGAARQGAAGLRAVAPPERISTVASHVAIRHARRGGRRRMCTRTSLGETIARAAALAVLVGPAVVSPAARRRRRAVGRRCRSTRLPRVARAHHPIVQQARALVEQARAEERVGARRARSDHRPTWQRKALGGSKYYDYACKLTVPTLAGADLVLGA